MKSNFGLFKRAFQRKPKPVSEQLHERKAESNKKAIIYTPWFKAFVRKNPGLIKDFLEAKRTINSGKNEAKAGKISVERLERRGNSNFALYKAKVGRKVFFIKEQNAAKQGPNFDPRTDLADAQIKALQKAREALKGIKQVEVANYHLAFRLGENSFLVTDFYDGENLNYSPFLNSNANAAELIDKIGRILHKSKIIDYGYYNMIWCPSKGKIIIFDLRLKN